MIEITEADGALLVTPGGQGASADYGGRLNPVAREIWRLADGRHTVEHIAREISRKFDVPEEKVSDDVRTFIDLLMNYKFLVIAGA
jgi:hypothetical protein